MGYPDFKRDEDWLSVLFRFSKEDGEEYPQQRMLDVYSRGPMPLYIALGLCRSCGSPTMAVTPKDGGLGMTMACKRCNASVDMKYFLYDESLRAKLKRIGVMVDAVRKARGG